MNSMHTDDRAPPRRAGHLAALLVAGLLGSGHAVAELPPEMGASVDIRSRHMNPPVYPADAASEGVQGRTILIVDIDAKGQVTNVAVEQSALDARLDAAALRAAGTWTFQPARAKGKPAPGRVRIPVDFALP